MNRIRREALARSAATQSGVTLLEVLIAMVVLSFGLISFAGLQAVSIKHSKISEYQTIAAQLASDFSDRLRANSVFAGGGGYDYTAAYSALGSALAVPGCAAPVCTAAEVRDIDLATWRNTARTALPGGSLYAELDPVAPVAPIMDLWVIWQAPEVGDENQIGNGCPEVLGLAADGPRCLHFRFAL